MKAGVLIFIGLIGSPGLACFAGAAEIPKAPVGPVVGNIAFALGDVFVDRARAKNGTPLRLGSLVTTDVGKATLLLGKSTVMHLDAESQLKITQYVLEHGKEESAQLDLRYGKTRALIFNKGVTKKNFQIKTKAAVMGVRGTHVYVDAPRGANEAASFMTVEGEAKVSFLSPAPTAGAAPPAPVSEVTLRSNDFVKGDTPGSDSKAGEPPPVLKLPPGEVQELANHVAPPPPELRTRGEAHEFGIHGPPPFPVGPPGPLLPPPPPPPPPIDPLTNMAPMILRIKGTVQ
ncbi:MAG: FecR domain-containing protein [Bacteriovoracia bacterium]